MYTTEKEIVPHPINKVSLVSYLISNLRISLTRLPKIMNCHARRVQWEHTSIGILQIVALVIIKVPQKARCHSEEAVRHSSREAEESVRLQRVEGDAIAEGDAEGRL